MDAEDQNLDTVLTVPQAAEGSRKDLLIALRTKLAVTIDNPKTPTRDIASLTRRLMDIVREIEWIDAGASSGLMTASHVPDEEWDGL